MFATLLHESYKVGSVLNSKIHVVLKILPKYHSNSSILKCRFGPPKVVKCEVLMSTISIYIHMFVMIWQFLSNAV